MFSSAQFNLTIDVIIILNKQNHSFLHNVEFVYMLNLLTDISNCRKKI